MQANPTIFYLELGFALVVVLLGGFLIWLVATRSRGDMGLTKKANRFKDLEGFVNEAKKLYRNNGELRDLYAVARKSGASKKFVKGLIAAGDRGGISNSPAEGALWYAQAIGIEPNSADAHFKLGKVALEVGQTRQDNRYLRVAHQAFTKAFLLERGHIQAFEHLMILSQTIERLYISNDGVVRGDAAEAAARS